MEHVVPKHEKIRFKPHEITDLAAYPSAAGLDPKLTRRRRPGRWRLWLVGAGGVAATLALAVVVAVYAIGVMGFGNERLRVEAEKALKAVAGPGMVASVGPAAISLDPSRLLALEVRDVRLRRADDGARVVDAASVSFGIRLWPLLSGALELSDARLSDVRVVTAALPDAGGVDWSAGLRDEQGLLAPDLAVTALFAAAHRAFDATRAKAIPRIALADVEFVLPAGGHVANVRVVSADLTEALADRLQLDATLDIDGRAATLAASAERDAGSGRIASVRVDVDLPASTVAAAPLAEGAATRIGSATLSLSGAEGVAPTVSKLTATLSLKGSSLDLGTRGVLSGDLDVAGTLAAGSNKIDVTRLRATLGRNLFDFYGAIGPRPATGRPDDRAAYRYDLISAKSTIAPEGSLEPALDSYIRLAGVYETGSRRLVADEIVVKSGPGETLGTMAVQFAEPGQAPGITAAFSVRDMAVAQVKQLWPWFSVRGARSWVFEHLFGGRVTEGRVQFAVPPNRLGNGVPLNENEVSGRFAITGTRFDTAGLIPPVREAVGAVEFRGNDVDIALETGVVYLPSGRSVAASAGRLVLKRANRPPLIGALDIDVAGEAPAITELASYEPINAMRVVGMGPDDFSGRVAGHVTADIPLSKGIDTKTLNWRVALDYEDLAVAKPIDGQLLTEATGSIVVDPAQAVIKAKGKLSGVPAEIDALEPLRDKTLTRKRLVRATLDDKMRDRLVPGIADMVSGPMKVEVDSLGGGKQRYALDLTDAELTLPWAGWSKGKGIDAAADFVLTKDDDTTTLSDFSLSGQTFGIAGSVTLAKGSLSAANFPAVRLNRGDDASVSVKRTGKGYAVAVTGKALDARPMIKRVTADTSSPNQGASGAISLDLDLDRVTGFNDETLSGLKLSYSGAGSRVLGLDATATARSGAGVEIRNGSQGGGRMMSMRSTDAGAVLRFLDIYPHMEGGNIALALKGGAEGPMTGQIDARDFWVVNEPRLSSLVSSRPAGSDMSLNEAVKRDIDTSRVKFDRAYVQLDKGDGYLNLAGGVLRGSLIGATFQGTLYDKQGNMDMTGTFMPAYGLNRIFGEIPLIGAILGNGRDRGLIGVTFRLSGDADAPKLTINPLSVIAPGIFRSIFEFQ